MTEQTIIHHVSTLYNIAPDRILTRSRYQPGCEARQLAMYLMRKQGMTLTSIGNVFGQHHATVSHAVKVIETRLEMNQMLVEV